MVKNAPNTCLNIKCELSPDSFSAAVQKKRREKIKKSIRRRLSMRIKSMLKDTGRKWIKHKILCKVSNHAFSARFICNFQ